MAKPTTEIDLSGFGLERLAHIGRGQYASAQHVKETATGATYVAKCISLAALNEHDQDLAHQEVFLLQHLNHKYIVGYRDSFLIEGANMLVIVMQYCDGGDLRKAIKDKAKAGEHFSEEQIMTWFVQLCLALQYIHSEKVLHRDLKTSNIFLADGGATIKLGDFGISRVLDGTAEAAVTIVGTPYYMSPEVCRSEPYNWKSDIWALGCVLYELCMLKHAFESSSLLGLVYKIVSDHYEPIPSFYSPQLNDLIHHLLSKSAESRPSINELFANPYVKAYLAKQAVPPPPPPPDVPVPDHQPKRCSLRPGGAPAAPPPPPPPAANAPPVPGPSELGPQSRLLVITARIRRRLIGQKLNWISAFAMFDTNGDGVLTPEALTNALTTMHLGLSEGEISELAAGLSSETGQITLDAFGAYLRDIPPEVHQYETWARQVMAPAGKRLREALFAKDPERLGTLEPGCFQSTLQELAPVVTPSQLDTLLLLADKNGLGDVDYCAFVDAFAAPLAPPQPAAAAAGAVPRGMPPLPGGGGPAAPKGMPPLPGAPAAPRGMPPLPGGPDLGNSLSIVDLNLDRTFFTCTSSQLAAAARSVGAQMPGSALSAYGCALIFSRLRRRLEAVGLPFGEMLKLFNPPGDKTLTSEQWLDIASSLPLGMSRAEMQSVFSSFDEQRTDRVAVAALEAGLSRCSPQECSRIPPWISQAMQNGLSGRLQQELAATPFAQDHPGLARESDFRQVVMRTERYLTSEQLNSLVLLADKTADGHVDFVEFASRFGGGAPPGEPLRVPGVSELPIPPPMDLPDGASIGIIGARTADVLERQGFAAELLPALLALWSGGDLSAIADAAAARLLATLPLGMSLPEAMALLSIDGGVASLALWFRDLQAQKVWKAQTDWAAANIPGQALRNVLRSQVADAESRSLEPAEFERALLDAGVAPGNVPMAMLLAVKGFEGDVRVAEFLAAFGGAAPPEAKKKRGLFSRFILGR